MVGSFTMSRLAALLLRVNSSKWKCGVKVMFSLFFLPDGAPSLPVVIQSGGHRSEGSFGLRRPIPGDERAARWLRSFTDVQDDTWGGCMNDTSVEAKGARVVSPRSQRLDRPETECRGEATDEGQYGVDDDGPDVLLFSTHFRFCFKVD